MDPQVAAKLALAIYAVGGCLALAGEIHRRGIGWQAWLLYAIQRSYSGLVYHWRSNRRCPFPEVGPALVIANHRSPVDPMMVWTNHHFGWTGHTFRVISFMMAREYYEIPGLNWLCRSVRSIPVDRDAKDMRPVRAALGRLRAGDLVGMFPEGRINLGSEFLEANPGVAWLALKARVPVYPVFIHDAPQGNSMIDPFCTFSRVRVSYGDPIDLSPYFHRKTSHALLEEVTDLLMQRLAETGQMNSNEPAAPTLSLASGSINFGD